MKKILALFLAMVAVFMFSSVVLAKNEAAIQNQNQVQTQNMGEEQELMIKTAEQEELQEASKSASPRSEMAKEKMSEVAKGVEEILTTRTLKGGIGDQVRILAQEQKQSQDQVRVQVSKLDGRNGLLKSMIGPDYKALKSLEKQMTQNELRIQQLTELKNKLTNSGDINMVQETIDALIQQNISLQDMINSENQIRSMLGWLFKLFVM